MRVLIGCVCAVFMLIDLPREGNWIGGRWLFCFAHANIFHLMANMVCLSMLNVRWWWWLVGYAISIACTFLPCPIWSWSEMGFVTMPSCGLSGVLMAVIGMLWGRAIGRVGFAKWGNAVFKWVLLPVVVTGFLPNMNALMHLWSFIGGVLASCIMLSINKGD